jgi:hypothetical protein
MKGEFLKIQSRGVRFLARKALMIFVLIIQEYEKGVPV